MHHISLHIKLIVPKFIYRTAVYVLVKYRCARYGYPFRKIKLYGGQYAKVDDKDFEQLNKYQWQLMKFKNTQYVFRNKNGFSIVHMHRQLMFGTNPKSEILKPKQILNSNVQNTKLDSGLRGNVRLVVHHVNHDGLDNRRANLRVVTYKQNAVNNQPGVKGTSKYKGVHWNKQKKRWVAGLRHNRKRFYLGAFEDGIEAAKAYDRAAKKYHGKYAWLNFPKDQYKSLANSKLY